MSDPIICPYCGREAQIVEQDHIYGRVYQIGAKVWWCKPCDAYVGCHGKTDKPLGTLANAETRHWRQNAHAAFDRLWKVGPLKRSKAYAQISEAFGFQVHIGESDVATCKRIIAWANEKWHVMKNQRTQRRKKRKART